MRHLTLLPLAALAALLPAGAVSASKPDTWPLKSLVLPGRGTVVVRYSPTALAEYAARDGKLVRVYDVGATPAAFDASADGRALAVLGDDLSVTLWDLRTGARRWRAGPLKGRDYYLPSDISFAHDGASLAVAADAVVVYDARTGAVRRSITADFLHARSVALSPDGKAGLALSWGGWVLR